MRSISPAMPIPASRIWRSEQVTAASNLKWFKDTFCDAEEAVSRVSGQDVYDMICEEAANAYVGSRGLLCFPFHQGRPMPYYCDAARAGVEENDLEIDAVMAIKNNTILGLHRFSDDIYHNVFSVAKSHLATAVGFAIDEGKLSLDDKPIETFADIIPGDIDPRWNDVTLYNLMTMTSGHGEPFLMASDRKKLRGETEEKLPEEMMNG
ncbi:serine hydrolase [Pseudoramibacter sp. HA2172]|uniref:serine hydrolase n=1 Tax=Pseudoramibacter faecis TaxID=3108534 RepID=UPI002E7787F0|nr:serine hydrolase [Pseudoramibacter sp. HA2172]